MKGLSKAKYRRIFYATIIAAYFVASCNLAQEYHTPTGTIIEAPVVLQTNTSISPSPTFNSQPTAEPKPSASAIPIGPNYLKDQGADLRIDKWSTNGHWLAYWLSEQEDLTSPSFPAPLGKLHFLNSQTGEICEHPSLVSSEYGSQIIWQPDDRAVVYSEDAYWRGLPCEDFTSIPTSEIIFPEIPDPSLSPNGSYQAWTEVRENTELVIKATTRIVNVSTGETKNSVDWEINQGEGELELGGEWITEDLFLIYQTREQGPLLIQVGAEVIQIAPELFGVPGIVHADPNRLVGLQAYASSVDSTNAYHILLFGIGVEAYFPPVRLYHSETGEVEELSYTHIWHRGFSLDGQWVLLDSRSDQDDYESYALWIRPVDPPGSELQLIEEGTYLSSWSPDQNKLAFGWVGSFSVLTFPAGEEIASWETGEYTISNLVWSPQGDFLAAVGNIPGEFDSVLFVVPGP